MTVGHVTVDVLADPTASLGAPRPGAASLQGARRQPGGGAFYSALQAARLGLRTLILTQGAPAEIEELIAPYRRELDLRVLPVEHTTTLLTHGSGHTRRQRLLAWAGPIAGPIEVDTAILHLAPVARETPRVWHGRAGFVGLTPQGLLREWSAAGELALAPLRRELLPERSDAWVLSEREHGRCAESIAHAAAEGTVVAVTAGAQPTVLHLSANDELLHVPVPPIACPRDDLGAGDVFAAAFFVALSEGSPPVRAAAFANAAAALRVGGIGPSAIGDRAAIEARVIADS